MFTEARKIHLLEEVIKTTDETKLMQLEAILGKGTSPDKQVSIYDLVGIMTKKEANKMRKAIEDSCENIDPDEWE